MIHNVAIKQVGSCLDLPSSGAYPTLIPLPCIKSPMPLALSFVHI